MTETGCTPGMAANSTRPAAATPPSVATSTISFAESGPDSSHAAPSTISDTATRSSASPARDGSRPAHVAAANAPQPAPTSSTLGPLDKHRLPIPRERDYPIGDSTCQRRVVGDDK